MKRFGQASRRMDWAGIILLSMMMGVLWLNSALAVDGNAFVQPDAPGILSGDEGCSASFASEGLSLL